MRSRREALLVADLGGSSLRMAVAARDGEVLAQAMLPLALAAEADPERWLADFAALAGETLASSRVESVAAIAITAFTRTEIHLDGGGRVLRPAMTFRDRRAEAEASAIDAGLGGRGIVTAFSPLARLAWMRRHEPGLFARLALVLQPKDFLNFRLTGVAAGDPASNAPLVGETRGYLPERFAAAELPLTLFPALRAPAETIGRVRPGLDGPLARLAGARVVVGCMDTWAATLGMGAHAVGTAYNLSGTTEVNGVMLGAPARADGLLGVAWDEGLFHLGGPSNAGGACLAWFAGLLGRRIEEVADMAARVDGGGELPLFLPYLDGERVPFWDPALRARFVGLDRGSDGGQLARAVMEGVAFHDRLVFARAAAATGAAPDRLLVAGGGASSDLWCQIKADAWNRAIERPAIAEAGLRGALLLAGAPPAPPRSRRFVADPRVAAALERRYRRFVAEIESRL